MNAFVGQLSAKSWAVVFYFKDGFGKIGALLDSALGVLPYGNYIRPILKAATSGGGGGGGDRKSSRKED